MRRAASNLLLPAFDHFAHMPRLMDQGIEGLEIAPFHTWPAAQQEISAGDVKIYRHAARASGLQIVGLHGLTAKPLQVGQLGVSLYRARMVAQLVHLSKVCRDLGGRTLIIEEAKRGSLCKRAAWTAYGEFMEEVLEQVAFHGTVFCLAPVGTAEADFCATPRDTFMLANAIDHDSYGIHVTTR